jgi:hypothetical protein
MSRDGYYDGRSNSASVGTFRFGILKLLMVL